MKRMENGLENEIAVYFSTEPLASHPHNHCVPIYEVLQIPDSDLDNEVIIVMPLLRPFDEPRFKSVGEAAEFLRQIFEVTEVTIPTYCLLKMFQGLHFMHQCNVAHRYTSIFRRNSCSTDSL